MDTSNDNSKETVSVAGIAEAAPAVTSAPAPAAPVPVGDPASPVSGIGTPHPSGTSPKAIKSIEANPPAGGPGAGAPKGELPKTNGKTPGGWNRFAGYDPHAAKNKPKDRDRGGSKGRR